MVHVAPAPTSHDPLVDGGHLIAVVLQSDQHAVMPSREWDEFLELVPEDAD